MEFAIVLPAMLLLIFGVIDFGRAVGQQIQLTEAVREGARVGALNGSAADMQNLVATTVGGDVTVTFHTVDTCAGSGSSSAAGNATVVAQRPFTAVTPVMSLMQYFGASSGTTITISATGVMACTG